MIIKGVAISDLHFGIRDSARLYKELSIVKDYLEKNDVQILNINGDYFDRKLSMTEPAANYAILFFDDLVRICKKKGIIMRVLQGTRSHDLNQISIFYHYSSDLNIKFFEEIAEEELFGAKFLYIPEEYPENSEEYYKEYKEKKYNLILGHGTWNEMAFADQIENGARNDLNTAPVFFFKEWSNSVENGVIIFGHIHSRHILSKKIYYPGSYTAWDFSDRSERGFATYEIDTDKNETKVTLVTNTLAPRYDVYKLKDHYEDFSKVSIEEVKTFIDELLKGTDNLKVDISGLSEEKIKMLREVYKDNSSIKFEQKDIQTLLEAKKETQEAVYDKYSYILKRELPLDKTVQRFIKEEYGKDIDLDKITKLITEV